MTLTEISGKLKIPVSTLYDTLKEVEKIFQFTIVLKESERNAPLRNITPVEFTYQVSIDTSAEIETTLSLPTE